MEKDLYSSEFLLSKEVEKNLHKDQGQGQFILGQTIVSGVGMIEACKKEKEITCEGLVMEKKILNLSSSKIIALCKSQKKIAHQIFKKSENFLYYYATYVLFIDLQKERICPLCSTMNIYHIRH